MSVDGIYFKCSVVTPEILPKLEMQERIQQFLNREFDINSEVTSCYIIYTLNDRDKATDCVVTLTKYFKNIFRNPTEDKFRMIRVKNKVFQNKVASIHGAHEFLIAAGFELIKMKFDESDEIEPFYVFPHANLRKIEKMLDILHSAGPIVPELDRNVRVLMVPERADLNDIQITADFYEVSSGELKREQKRRIEQVVENTRINKTFRTQTMTVEDDKKELLHCQYTVIRIRFPDGIILQGTFSVHENVSDVQEFVRGCLVNDWQPFVLITATGIRLAQTDFTLHKLRLLPAVVIYFSWDTDVASHLKEEAGIESDSFLNEEMMSMVENLMDAS